MKYPLVYLTGMPASGKTTTSNSLKNAMPEVEILEYSQLLADHLSTKHNRGVAHLELRTASSGIITPEDVEAVDDYLIKHAHEVRTSRPVVVVSHPATREQYGFRVLMFSQELLKRLNPSSICMLVCSPETIADRVNRNSEGRPQDTLEQTRTHACIQTAIATVYASTLGVPLYFLETDAADELVVPRLIKMLSPS